MLAARLAGEVLSCTGGGLSGSRCSRFNSSLDTPGSRSSSWSCKSLSVSLRFRTGDTVQTKALFQNLDLYLRQG